MALKDLLERRTRCAAAMRKLVDAPAGDGGDLSADQAAEFERHKNELESLDTRIDRQRLVDEAERRAKGETITGTGDDRLDAEAAQVGMLDVIRAQLGDTSAAAGRAREVSAELQRRSGRKAQGMFWAMNVPRSVETRVFTTTAPAAGPGGNIIAQDYRPDLFIDRLRNRVVIRRLGARVLTGLQGNLTIPRMKASSTVYWVPENGAITASDPQTEQVSFTPKHAGVLTEVSRNMVQQASPDVERLLQDDMALELAQGIDSVAIKGGGTNEPSGLLAAGSGIGSVVLGTNGAAPTWDAIIGLISAVDQSNALDGSLAFLTNAKAVKKMRTTAKTTTDAASNMLMNAATELAGYPLANTNLVPSNGTKGTGTNLSSMIFGDFSQLFIGFWSELDILVNPYASGSYEKGNVLVRAMATCDVKIRQPLAFAAITDMVTT